MRFRVTSSALVSAEPKMAMKNPEDTRACFGAVTRFIITRHRRATILAPELLSTRGNDEHEREQADADKRQHVMT
jgi:hypothetical protein